MSLTDIVATLRPLGTGSVQYISHYAPGIALIVLDNPVRHNALSGKMMAELHDIVQQLEQVREDLVAVILTGSAGKSFCAGLDLEFAAEHLRKPGVGEGLNRLMHDTLSRFARLPYITVASMAGHALGGGTELLSAFDFVCMAETAFIRFVQTRMGVSSPWGGARRLINLVGRKQALRILASAPKIDAATAKQLGLADVVVATSKEGAYDACLKASVAFLQPFVMERDERVAPAAVRAMKQLISKADLEADSEFELQMLARLAGSSKL